VLPANPFRKHGETAPSLVPACARSWPGLPSIARDDCAQRFIAVVHAPRFLDLVEEEDVLAFEPGLGLDEAAGALLCARFAVTNGRSARYGHAGNIGVAETILGCAATMDAVVDSFGIVRRAAFRPGVDRSHVP
jgi:hypothetical protein